MLVYKQGILGRLTAERKNYRLFISGKGVFNPVYTFEEDDLDLDTIVGFTTIVCGRQNLVISSIYALFYSKKTTEKLITIPILHFGDKRKVEDLAVSRYTLTLQGIDCIFKKEDDVQ